MIATRRVPFAVGMRWTSIREEPHYGIVWSIIETNHYLYRRILRS